MDLRPNYIGSEVIHTIYFGGGTPSVLPSKDIQRMIEAVRTRYVVNPEVEITIEANPDDLSEEYLRELRDTEINRLSIGIQSFHEDELLWMNRAHSAVEAERCLELCHTFDFHRYSLDLIFGVPISTSERWISNMEKAISYEPDHLSCYALTVEEKTAYHKHIIQGKSTAPPDELTEKQFYQCHDFLAEAGYEHYEISNYARKNSRSKHNSAYWSGVKYLGLGPAAHSYDGKNRGWNVAHMVKYLEGINAGEVPFTEEILNVEDQYNEYVMTAIRLIEGISLDRIGKEFPSIENHFYEALKEIPSEYVDKRNERLCLTRKGLIFADFVGGSLFRV